MAYCPNCGSRVDDRAAFCSTCGTRLGAPPPYVYGPRAKDPGEVAVIALALGLAGIMGAGHLYIGMTVRGLVFLALGLLPFLVAVVSILALPGNIGTFLGLVVVVQTVDAYNKANELARIPDF
jgi:TM2 domain-containing membrane protein YozV